MVKFNLIDYTLGGSISNIGRIDTAITDVFDEGVGSDGIIPNNTGGGGTKITESNYTFNIKSNIKGASVLINGELSKNITPSQIKITKQNLIEDGDKTITLTKSGYISNEKYVIKLDTNENTLVKSPFISGGYGNLSQSSIVIDYYVNDIKQPYPKVVNTLKELSFTLSNKNINIVEEETVYDLSINISGIDGGNAVLLRKNAFTSANMFPSKGFTKYSDVSNTKYNISSSDLSLYRIVKITYNKLSDRLSKTSPIVSTANDDESLTLDIKLNDNYVVDIVVEDIVKDIPLIKPKVKLLNNSSRTYNINSENGVPIGFEKNESVTAITIIVGDDILEFDDLEKGTICGVTIPHSVFEKIGKYNIKIFPFSLSEYEEMNNPKPPKPQIKPKPVRPLVDITEVITPVKPIIKTNPYINTNPIYSNVSNNIKLIGLTGGGGRGSYDS